MVNEWPDTRLGDVCNLLTGFPFKSAHYTDAPSGIRLVRGDNVVQGGLRWDGVKKWPCNEVDGLQQYSLQEDDVVLAMDRPWIDAGLKYAALSKHDLPALLVQRVSRLRGGAQLDTRFLKYLIGSEQFTNHVLAVQTGTAVPHISAGQIKSFSFRLPPVPTQQRIAEILGTLDDKIELNRRMNETLEAMARRLFKSWFIDFDPVHAKAALRREHPKLSNADLSRRALPNMAPEIAELFPDSFEDSTLGRIPRGWRSRPLYDIAKFVNGAAFKNSDFCDPSIGKPVIKIAELKSGIDSQTKFSQKHVGPDREIHCGDTLYSWSGSPDTSLATFRWTGRDGLLNQHIFKVITDNRPDEIFAYYQLNDLRDTLVEIARNKQTTGLGHVTVEDMKRLQVVHPAPEALKAFASNAGPIYDQSFTLSVDSLTLEQARDKLLPRLLSGDLQLHD